ncbi:hypothetical protein TNCT_587111 [Trichonephila clavata]|uniref:Uncharacterized protein n=1 Tax=Trichonephila clavata TaxID=2740835 RepID=A0A8X6HIE1_TRICU|nr:hypothetical protein TNCT_587111 [Trichonephila clavata]
MKSTEFNGGASQYIFQSTARLNLQKMGFNCKILSRIQLKLQITGKGAFCKPKNKGMCHCMIFLSGLWPCSIIQMAGSEYGTDCTKSWSSFAKRQLFRAHSGGLMVLRNVFVLEYAESPGFCGYNTEHHRLP